MAKFSDLPNELVVEIWSHIPHPRDIENFAFASKTIRTLAGKVLVKHRELTRELLTFNIGGSKSKFSVAGLLKEILTNPGTALYIKTVTMTSLHQEWESEEEGVNTLKAFDPDAEDGKRHYRHTRYAEEDMKLFEQTIERAKQFLDFRPLAECQCYQRAKWQVSRLCGIMKNGNELPIIVLLLLLFTNLKALVIEYTAVDAYFFDLLRCISAAPGIPILKRPIKVKVLNADAMAESQLRKAISVTLGSATNIKGRIAGVMPQDRCFSFDLRAWSMNVDGMWTQ